MPQHPTQPERIARLAGEASAALDRAQDALNAPEPDRHEARAQLATVRIRLAGIEEETRAQGA